MPYVNKPKKKAETVYDRKLKKLKKSTLRKVFSGKLN